MAKRRSILAHSKRVENKVARFLFGPQARRAWKEDWDILWRAPEGDWWLVEVKATSEQRAGAVIRLLREALLQATAYRERLRQEGRDAIPVGVVWVKRTRLRLAATWRDEERPELGMCVMTLQDFRAWLYGMAA